MPGLHGMCPVGGEARHNGCVIVYCVIRMACFASPSHPANALRALADNKYATQPERHTLHPQPERVLFRMSGCRPVVVPFK